MAKRILLGALVSLILLWLVTLAVEGGRSALTDGVVRGLTNSVPWLVLAYLPLYLVQLALRALRFQWLLQLSQESRVPRLGALALVTGVRNMLVDVIPARLGELSYVALLNRVYGVKSEHAVSSLALSIVLDIAAMLVIVSALATILAADPSAQQGVVSQYAPVLSVVIAAVVLLGVFYIGPPVLRVVSTLLRPSTSSDWRSRACDWLGRLATSIENVRFSGGMWRLMLLSLGIRLIKYSALVLLFVAVASPSFPELATVTVAQIMGGLIGAELASSLPVPALMGFGVFEAGSLAVFYLLEVAEPAALFATMLVLHIWSQLFDYTLGTACCILLWWQHRRINRTA